MVAEASRMGQGVVIHWHLDTLGRTLVPGTSEENLSGRGRTPELSPMEGGTQEAQGHEASGNCLEEQSWLFIYKHFVKNQSHV